jgi:hypothetical protein
VREARRFGQPVLDHRRRVVAPEQRVADLQRRHAEHPGSDRGVGVRAQLQFHRIAGERACRIVHAERARRLVELGGGGAAASIAPQVIEDRRRCRPVAAGGDAKPQRGERIERMHGREAQRHARALGRPLHKAISELALARNLGRPELAVMLENGTEHDRLGHDVQAPAKRQDRRQLEIGERRNEVEIPEGGHAGRRGRTGLQHSAVRIPRLRDGRQCPRFARWCVPACRRQNIFTSKP